MKIGGECYVHGYVDEIRKDTVIIRNDGGYFGTVKSEIVDAPTVDAVPIEWLIRQKNKHNNDGFAWIFEAVMEDWRKDNETD